MCVFAFPRPSAPDDFWDTQSDAQTQAEGEEKTNLAEV